MEYLGLIFIGNSSHPIASDNFYYPGYAGIGTQLQDSENELPPEATGQPNYESYSHRLSHIGLISASHVKALVYSWTHRSADRTNTIEPNSITQIPLVKLSICLQVPL